MKQMIPFTTLQTNAGNTSENHQFSVLTKKITRKVGDDLNRLT